MNINTGGPAFPKAGNEFSEMEWVPAAAESGMTLRDYFAAKAMQTIMHSYDMIDSFSDDEVKEAESFQYLMAKDAYIMADAMLKARGK